MIYVFPYSNSVSDLVLKDRKYQNYSLCDNNCEYNGIELKENSIACSCKIKTNIKSDIEPCNFGNIVEDTFIYSNFGVIKCYNLVFNFRGKKNTIDFLVFLFLKYLFIKKWKKIIIYQKL